MKILSDEEVRAWLKLKPSDASQDGVLVPLENRLPRVWEDLTGQWIGATEARTHYASGTGSVILYLPSRVLSLTSLSYLSGIATWSDVVDDLGVEVLVDGRRLELLTGAVFGSGARYRVVYNTGYADPKASVPEDVKHALLEIMELAFKNREGPVALSPESGAPIFRNLSKQANAVIAAHRVVVW